MDVASGLLKLTSAATLVVGIQLMNSGIALAATAPLVDQSSSDATFVRQSHSLINLDFNQYVPPDKGGPDGTEGAGTR